MQYYAYIILTVGIDSIEGGTDGPRNKIEPKLVGRHHGIFLQDTVVEWLYVK